jgi:hypothetical protein
MNNNQFWPTFFFAFFRINQKAKSFAIYVSTCRSVTNSLEIQRMFYVCVTTVGMSPTEFTLESVSVANPSKLHSCSQNLLSQVQFILAERCEMYKYIFSSYCTKWTKRAPNVLTLILLTWKIWWAPNSASKRQMVFNSGFKGLTHSNRDYTKVFLFLLIGRVIKVFSMCNTVKPRYSATLMYSP